MYKCVFERVCTSVFLSVYKCVFESVCTSVLRVCTSMFLKVPIQVGFLRVCVQVCF